ncbi:NAD(P)-dependent dehydrogenase (short-subunit alcohol dehydrogenase family) [Kushneria sinocarnis]|uniref:NAD(P)-dependent dehydrogenase (Short-subunit alcohol dehydrogenase family) n=1 Tax=Kushneria sinocarnis TaxID=595502 RepID=A0A420WVW7_9GAMM|nr:D-threitol dehydrogenase [Kushneria sinocarnis]RKR03261.1 NAD(P)-dependent dehydrogenase (short-subunit alcohol dehydrogenase family) [Kushneria sinocarnis]
MAEHDPWRLDGQVVLVTGASAGIGLAICSAMARQGARLAMLDRDDRVHEAAAGFEDAIGVVADVTRSDELERARDEITDRLGPIDVLVNNAGVIALDAAESLSEQDWDRTLDVNLKGTFLASQVVGRQMLERGEGAIVNIASQAGLVALDQHLAYCASKAGVIGLTRSLALEWSPRGVRVNAVSPTIVMTELGQQAWSGPEGDRARERIPLRRFAEPEDVANAVVHLASPAAAMLSGENLVVDGGYTIS